MKPTKALCNSVMVILFLMMAFNNTIPAQDLIPAGEDSLAVRQAALDYVDGFYSGDAARIEKAVHPDLNKATPKNMPQNGRTALFYTTYSTLLELARAGIGSLDDTARHLDVRILDIGNDVANVKITSSRFTDYVQEVNFGGKWMIVNVLYTSGSDVPPWLKDFDSEAEKSRAESTALAYLAGMTAGDAAHLEKVIAPDYNKVTLFPVTQTGKTALRRQRYSNIIENALAGAGKQDEVYRNNHADLLDIFDGIAIARCEMAGAVEYVQMYLSDGDWKVFNVIARPNPKLTLSKALAAIAGEPMPEFTLPVHGGGTFNLADYKGKNVLLVFPRGWVGNQWCAYCPYQYLEFEKLEKTSHIMKKYNTQIAFVMPYSNERIADWLAKFPDALKTIENIKNPQQKPEPGSIRADYAAWAREHFPHTYEVSSDDLHTVIPILADEDRTLSRQLKISTNFWDNITSEQNIASVFIVDKNGILKYKYIGQMTEDRPSTEFLVDYIKNMK